MEDINNALLHIKAKHNGEIPYQYGSRECAELMHSYALEHHKAKLKLLGIADVVDSEERTELPASTIPEFGTDEWTDCCEQLFGGMRKSR